MQHFNNEQEACDWLFNVALDGEECIDNYRFAYQDDSAAMTAYENAKDNGCCGFYDVDIMVANRLATIGCNYGH